MLKDSDVCLIVRDDYKEIAIITDIVLDILPCTDFVCTAQV